MKRVELTSIKSDIQDKLFNYRTQRSFYIKEYALKVVLLFIQYGWIKEDIDRIIGDIILEWFLGDYFFSKNPLDIERETKITVEGK